VICNLPRVYLSRWGEPSSISSQREINMLAAHLDNVRRRHHYTRDSIHAEIGIQGVNEMQGESMT
jgi:hypothetical protein